MKITLRDPVKSGSAVISELTLREKVCAGDFRGIPARNPMFFDDLLKIAGRLSAQEEHVINALSSHDMQVVLEAVGGFLQDSPSETGTTPSP